MILSSADERVTYNVQQASVVMGPIPALAVWTRTGYVYVRTVQYFGVFRVFRVFCVRGGSRKNPKIVPSKVVFDEENSYRQDESIAPLGMTRRVDQRRGFCNPATLRHENP